MYIGHVQGSVLYNHFTHGKLERSEGSSITEGLCYFYIILSTVFQCVVIYCVVQV